VVVTSAARATTRIQAARQRGIAVLKQADLWREWSRQRGDRGRGHARENDYDGDDRADLTRAGREPAS
jgi:hypothetical protein